MRHPTKKYQAHLARGKETPRIYTIYPSLPTLSESQLHTTLLEQRFHMAHRTSIHQVHIRPLNSEPNLHLLVAPKEKSSAVRRREMGVPTLCVPRCILLLILTYALEAQVKIPLIKDTKSCA